MSPDKLRDYRNWYDLNAREVLTAVQQTKGGWKTIFPKGIPCWLSRLRNYFNVTPHFLMRYDEKRADFIYDWQLVKRGFMESHAGSAAPEPIDAGYGIHWPPCFSLEFARARHYSEPCRDDVRIGF